MQVESGYDTLKEKTTFKISKSVRCLKKWLTVITHDGEPQWRVCCACIGWDSVSWPSDLVDKYDH